MFFTFNFIFQKQIICQRFGWDNYSDLRALNWRILECSNTWEKEGERERGTHKNWNNVICIIDLSVWFLITNIGLRHIEIIWNETKSYSKLSEVEKKFEQTRETQNDSYHVEHRPWQNHPSILAVAVNDYAMQLIFFSKFWTNIDSWDSVALSLSLFLRSDWRAI